MQTDGICAERDRLSGEATSAVHVHNEIVSKVADRKADAEQIILLRNEMRTSFLAAQAAREEYREHIEEHGC